MAKRPVPPLKPNPKLSTFPYGGGEWPGYWTEAMERIARFEAEETDGLMDQRRRTLSQRLMQTRTLVLGIVVLGAMATFAFGLLFATGLTSFLAVVLSLFAVGLVIVVLVEQLDPYGPGPPIDRTRRPGTVEQRRQAPIP